LDAQRPPPFKLTVIKTQSRRGSLTTVISTSCNAGHWGSQSAFQGTAGCTRRHSRAVQNTMLIAIAGVTVAVVLRPISMMRTPSSAPMRLLQLYSIAGANPSEYEEPD